MKYLNDPTQPSLLATIEQDFDIKQVEQIKKQVETLNEWLRDSGMPYEYTVATRGDMVYIEPV